MGRHRQVLIDSDEIGFKHNVKAGIAKGLTMRFYIARGTITDSIKIFVNPPEKLLSELEVSTMWDGDVKGDFAAKPLLSTLLPLTIKPAECVEVDVQTKDDGVSVQIVRRNVKCKTSIY